MTELFDLEVPVTVAISDPSSNRIQRPVDEKVTDTCAISIDLREKCVRIYLIINSTIQRRSRSTGRRTKKNTNKIGTTGKERGKDPERHDKETDRYGNNTYSKERKR